ncbi:MAG: hypothetical protein U5J62_11835 [Desulfurivibrio sp.]|nr:hypothetical protein [Desulfurivibrio sp.]
MKEHNESTVRRRYARLPLALALGAMVLTPAVIGAGASDAEANVGTKGETSISITGNARVMGYATNNDNFDDTTAGQEDEDRRMRHRLRLMLDGQLAGGTSFHSRLNIAGWDTWGDANDNQTGQTDVNWLYFKVPLAYDITTIAGRQRIDYGHKMRTYDSRSDRLTFVKQINDELKLLAYYAKTYEDSVDYNVAGADNDDGNDQDDSSYAIGGEYDAGALKGGFRLVHLDDKRGANHTSVNNVTPLNGDGQFVSAYGTYKAGDLTFKGEVDFRRGDRYENADNDDQYATYFGADYKMGDTTFSGGFAAAMNGYTGDNDFDGISLFYDRGDGAGLGHSNFGALANGNIPTNANAGAGEGDSEYAIGAEVNHQYSPKLSVRGGMAYISAEDTNNNEIDVAVLDAGISYKINGSTAYKIDGIYGSPDIDDAIGSNHAEDAYWGVSHRFEIKF